MAKLIEGWLGNPVTRKILSFCTNRCTCGRRIELILKDYAGEKQELCIRCKTARFIVGKILDGFAGTTKTKKADIILTLKDPVWRKGLAAVLEGIAKYGPTKPFTSYSPFLIVWNVTKACNLACKHCYEDAHKRAPDEFTTEEALHAVDKMAGWGVAYIAISGGEPLARSDLFKIAKRIKENEMGFSIATNATLLTKEKVKKLKAANCLYIQVSLDGAKASTHNAFRGRKAFEKTIKGIRNAVGSGMAIGIAMTITKHNLKEVPAAIDLAEKLGVDLFMHYNFIPTGRGKGIVNLDIGPKEREKLLEYLASQIGKRGKLSILSTAPQYAKVCSAFGAASSLTHFDVFSQSYDSAATKFLADFIGGCGTARLYCAIEPNGNIEPCVFIPIVCGNIRKDDLIDVWQNNKTMKELRDRKNFKGNCQKCVHRNICGGCRARAYGYYKDVRRSDPGCILNEKEWQKLKEKGS
ncbi:MAG: radical SAM protein [Candidatus Diapherotrites archaeon]